MQTEILYENGETRWIDLLDVKKEDISLLADKYQLNILHLEDCIDANHLPKYEDSNETQFFLLRQNTSAERVQVNSIADISTKLGLFVKQNTLITIHRMESDTLKKTLDFLHKKDIPITTKQIALQLALQIFSTYEEENQTLLEQMETMESEIFLKNVANTAQLKRLYRFKRKVGLNQKTLLLSQEAINGFDNLNLEPSEVKDLKDSYKDALTDFEHLNNQSNNLISLYLALSDQRANQVMKLLAIYSVYFLPITFIAGLYGMNFEYMPELKKPYGYYITLGVMLTIVIFTFFYMRRKRW